MDNDRDIEFDIVIGHPLEEQFCVFKIFEMSANSTLSDIIIDNDVLN